MSDDGKDILRVRLKKVCSRLGMAASLDHSMWFHRRDFRIDTDWLLYETESTIAGERGYYLSLP